MEKWAEARLLPGSECPQTPLALLESAGLLAPPPTLEWL